MRTAFLCTIVPGRTFSGRQDLVAVLRVVVDQLGGRHELGEHRLGGQLAGLRADDTDDLLGPVEHQVAHGQEVRGALVEAQGRPGGQVVPGDEHRRGDVRRAVVGNTGEHLAGARVAGLDERLGVHAHDVNPLMVEMRSAADWSPVGTGVTWRWVTPASA